MKFSSKKVTELMKKLSEDPVVASAINNFKQSSSAEAAYNAQSITDFLTYILKIGVSFLGKRRAKVFVEIIEAVGLLVTLSIFLKKNLFDRPEVQQFFKESWGSIGKVLDSVLSAAQEYVAKAIKVAKKAARR